MKRLTIQLVLLLAVGCYDNPGETGRRVLQAEKTAYAEGFRDGRRDGTYNSRPIITPYTFKVDGTKGACAHIKWCFSKEWTPHGFAFVRIELSDEFAKHWELGTPTVFSVDSRGVTDDSACGEIHLDGDHRRVIVAQLSGVEECRTYYMRVPLYPVKGNPQSVDDAIAEMEKPSPVWPVEVTVLKRGAEFFIPQEE